MTPITRIFSSAALAACMLVACSPAGGETQTDPTTNADAAGFLNTVSFADSNGSVIIGNPDAAVELVEFASLTCGHCRDFHENVLSVIKKDYIATGKVRFVFQEFPTAPVEVALVGFATGRCSGESGYLGVLDDFFGTQDEIFTAARNGTILAALTELAARHGVNENEFDTCISNQDHRRAVADSVNYGQSLGVNSTPSLLLNGEKLETTASRTPEGLAELIDAALTETSTVPAETED